MNASYFDEAANAALYKQYRPQLPPEVFQYAASLCESDNGPADCDLTVESPNRKFAIDLACGSGQATEPMSKYFQKMIGVDLSQAQLNNAPKLPNVTYRVGPAEELDFLEDGSVDLVMTVAALHWMEIPRIFDVVKRVLRKGGIFFASEYMFGHIQGNAEAGEMWDKFLNEDTKHLYPKGWVTFNNYTLERFHMENKSENKSFSWTEEWTFEKLMGFCRSNLVWLSKIPGHENDVAEFHQKLLAVLRKDQPDVPENEIKVMMKFPVIVLTGRK